MSFIQIYPKDSKPNNEAYMMPWESDAICYNFNEPEVFIPDDSIDEMIKDPMDVETLVVTADLKDYRFIEKMKNLKQLYLYNAGNFWDLSVIKDLIYLSQICILHSEVLCLDGLDELLRNKKKAADTASNDLLTGTLYGIEGVFIHSDESRLRLKSIYDYGVYIGELNLILYTGGQTEESSPDKVPGISLDHIRDRERTRSKKRRGSSDRIRAIILRSNMEYEVAYIKKASESLKSITGGDIEGLTFAGHTDFILFINEIGKIIGLPVNTLASVFSLEFVSEIPMIYGNAVISGLDEDGDTCDLTDEQIRKFTKILDGID